MYYAVDTPQLQDAINGKTLKVSGVCTKQRPLKKGDKFTIQSQAASGGGTDVTFTFGGTCFSFIAK